MPILGSIEITKLLKIINDEKKTLRNTEIFFNRNFNKSQYFRIGCAICMMVQDKVLTKYQRIVAFYILCFMFRSDQSASNPFLPFFLDSVEFGSDENEKKYLVQLLMSHMTNAQMIKKSPVRILYELRNVQVDIPDLRKLRQIYASKFKVAVGFSSIGIRNILPFPEPRSSININPQYWDENKKDQISPLNLRPKGLAKWSLKDIRRESEFFESSPYIWKVGAGKQNEEEQLNLRITGIRQTTRREKEPCLLGFQLNFARPAPPLMEVTDVELCWINVEDAACLLWDTSICKPKVKTNIIRDLLIDSFTMQLNPTQQQEIINEIRADPSLVHQCNLTPQRLPLLVESNPMIAIECLLKLVGTPPMNDLLSSLVNMDMSLHSMEVVNRLTVAVKLPTEFIRLFISNCISSCETIADKPMQVRLVKLVCVFLQSLIRNKIVNVKDIFIEVQAFCIEFSKIREAAGLFRFVNSLE